MSEVGSLSIAERTATDAAAMSEAVTRAIVSLTGCAPERVLRSSELVADLGIDSYLVVELLVTLEKTLGRTLARGEESRLASVQTVGQLVEGLLALTVVDCSGSDPCGPATS